MYWYRVEIGRRLGVVALVLGLLLAAAPPGLAQDDDVVSRVNGESISRAEFVARVRLARWQYVNELSTLYDLTAGNLALAPALVQSLASNLQQSRELAEAVLTQMERERLLAREGESLGLTPSAEDARSEEDRFFSTWTNVPVESLASSPTAQAFVEDWYSGATGASSMTREAIRALFADKVLNARLYEHVSASVPEQEMAAHTRHILCAFNPADPGSAAPPTDEQRSAAQACIRHAQMRLANGDPFAQVAQDLSDDSASAVQGGDVGWTLMSYLAEAYADVAANAELNTVVGPVETEYGLHLVEVLGRELRPLTDDEYATAQQGYYALWLQTLYDEADIARSPTWAADVPTEPGLESLDPAVQSAIEEVLAGS